MRRSPTLERSLLLALCAMWLSACGPNVWVVFTRASIDGEVQVGSCATKATCLVHGLVLVFADGDTALKRTLGVTTQGTVSELRLEIYQIASRCDLVTLPAKVLSKDIGVSLSSPTGPPTVDCIGEGCTVGACPQN